MERAGRHAFLLICFGPLACTSVGPTSDFMTVDGSVFEKGRAADRQVVPEATPTLPCAASLTLAPLQLEAGYCVSARFELPGTTAAFALHPGRLLALQAGGGSPFVLEVTEQSLGSGQQTGARQPFFSATVNATSTGKLFAGEYLALSPAGTAAVGYTEGGTFAGAIFLGTRGAQSRTLEKATGNFDALFLDERTLLVNGTGLGSTQEGVGVYLWRDGQSRRLVKDLGTFSGHLALTEKVLLVGGYSSSGNKIYGFTLEEVRAAIAASRQLTPADGDLVHAGEVLDAASFEESLVVVRSDPATYQPLAVSRLPLSASDMTVTAGAALDLIAFPAAPVLTLARVTAHQAQLGLLFTAGGDPQLVLVRKRP